MSIEVVDMKALYTEKELMLATSRQKLPCECTNCNNPFLVPKNEILRFLRGKTKNGRSIKFCSRECHNKHKDTRVLVPCTTCGGNTTRRESETKKGNVFCSHSCAAKWNNRKYPKRNKQLHRCVKCGKQTTRECESCMPCFQKERIEQYGNLKVGNFKSEYARHKYQRIRQHAHRIARLSKIKKICSVCGYTLNVQLCHRIAIASFPKDALLKDVNAASNLVFLCGNHHWEIEHGYRDCRTLMPTDKMPKIENHAP